MKLAADGGARRLHATAVSQTGLTLAWDAPPGATFVLRRTPGSNPVSLRDHGTGVPVKGTTATVTGLKAGQRHTYSLFTLVKGRWTGPLVLTAGTAAPAGSGQATYVTAPGTLLAAPADLVSAAPTGSGVRAVLQPQTVTPPIGAGLVLPMSATLPGGFLGVVTAVSTDGRTLDLRAGGLSDAFDYYELTVADIAAVPGTAAPAPATAAPEAKVLAAGCTGLGAEQTVAFQPDLALGGRFATKVDKYRFLGADVPTGASLDMEMTVRLTGAATIDVESAVDCGIDLKSYSRQLTVSPVPIAVLLTPNAQVSVNGAVTVSNLGYQATSGVRVKGSMTIKNGPSFTGSPITEITPLTPTVTSNGSVGLAVGGELAVGPGVGTSGAGVIAGISGELTPLDAEFGPRFPMQDPRFNACLRASAAFVTGLSLTAKAWLSNGWSFSEKISLDALQGEFDYPGSPWHLPAGCQDLPGTEPQDSLLGGGVTKVEDAVSGGADQWGHVDGFAPGKKAWVLSTGRIADATGTPGVFASTGLGGPGDDELTALAGYPTHDAAAYTVTLTPAGSTLHVRYVFASEEYEEYPEFVGSSFNDVMVVRVDGKNCATVPGTTTPVSVNTINAQTNSAYYVDNAGGANGYSTSMDGLTVPLTCAVPVTPGKAVTVQIAVADTSDHAYDSAVALLDGGIWTD
ncbi:MULTISPECIES: choice-of-anchor L domain-containing protein [Catenuloplanes]|uniref:Fibronectin type-III domain-containing protein n=1 Tax=Catenuloplanes niger TaxID=587534 RepID=A0AAE4CS60_9ACTN|nr:choice-of-anchor L domain-containing protein [Catenuloplanes niger]MDR7320878.1 hypothetical protein [Catenuloplanes niger]